MISLAELPRSGSLQSLAALPVGALVALGVLAVIEIGLDVVALVMLVRTPKERVTLPKWGWAALIVFVNLFGAVLFLVLGRRPAPAASPVAADARERPSAASVADSLYGARKTP